MSTRPDILPTLQQCYERVGDPTGARAEPRAHRALEIGYTWLARDAQRIGNGRRRTYKELSDWSNRIAHALVEDYGVKPGNRVLIRSANNPAMVACWLAATKVGAVVVNTMPMLRSGELTKIVDKAEISHAICDSRFIGDLRDAERQARGGRAVHRPAQGRGREHGEG